MITQNDFNKKQIVFVLCTNGEKLSVKNENLTVTDEEGKVKLQVSFYRLFLVYIVGNCSITSVLIQKANKFGFYIAMLTGGYRLYSIVGAPKDGNTMLKRKQYCYSGLGISKKIVCNKINNQIKVLKNVRIKSEAVKCAIEIINTYIEKASNADSLNELMAYEGLASKLYFRNHFNNIVWNGRQPRIKRDYVNSVLDIGYTLLFSFVDAILSAYGFDTYVGILHRQFYMRKSLVCDIIEPFRILVDISVKKGINLKQIKEDDFIIINHQYMLKWESNPRYIQLLMEPILENKEQIFSYIHHYYLAFMKELPPEEFPTYNWE